MATLLNDRNELLFSAPTRVTGATVTASSGAATSLIVPQGATAPTPATIELTALVTGYITPAYSWSYRFGNTGTFTNLTATTNPITVTCDAAYLTAAGTNTVVQYRVQVSETTSNIGINQSEYILSIPILREGQNGVDAINNVQVVLYRRTTTNVEPEVITTGDATYTFSNAQVVGQPANWTQAIPSATSGAYLWVIRTSAVSVGTYAQFANTLWSTPVLYSQDGINGAPGTNGTNGNNGTNTALVYAYKRAATAPSDNPGGVTYSFTTSIITTTLANNWLKTIPSGTDPLYVTVATASSATSTDTIAALEWSSPVLLVQNGTPGTNGTNGSPGANGINTASAFLYSRNNNSTTPPTLATAGTAIYTFGTGVLSGTIPDNWTQTLPVESAGSVIWAVQATAASNTATDSIVNTEWSTPRVLAQKGTDGTNGTNGTNGTRGSRQLYNNNAAHTSAYTLAPNAAGAESYAVQATNLIAAATSGTIPTTPITGDTVTFTNGTDYVYTVTYNSSTGTWSTPGTVIDGSLLVTGSVTAAKINSNGLSIRDDNGNVILSASSKLSADNIGSGQVATDATVTIGGAGTDAPLVLTGSGEIISNGPAGDKARFYYGNVEIYKDVPNVGSVMYKALSRVEAGVASNSTEVTIPGYFRSQPKVLVSPASLQLYSVAYANQSQSIICSANNLTESSAGSMVWKFTPVAQLVLSANSSTTVLNTSSGILSSNTWTSANTTSPANTSTLQISVNLTSYRGNASSQYYYRQVVWKVQYSNNGGTSWADSTSRTVTIGQTLNAVTDSLIVALPSSDVWLWRVVTTASDVGSTVWGSVTYVAGTTYNSTNAGSFTVTAPGNNTNYYTNFTMSAVSLAAGESVTSVKWTYTATHTFTGNISTGVAAVSGPGYQMTPGGGGLTGTTSVSNTITTTTFSTAQSIAAYAGSTPYMTAKLVASNFRAVITTRKPAPNSTTPSNVSVINSVIYSLTGATVLATGSLNWMALGE